MVDVISKQAELIADVETAIQENSGILLITTKKTPKGACQCGRPECDGGYDFRINIHHASTQDIAMSLFALVKQRQDVMDAFAMLLMREPLIGERMFH